MPYPTNHMLLAWGGNFIAGDTQQAPVDEFAGSMRFVGPGVANAQNEATIDALTDVLSLFWANADAFIPNRAVLGYVKWNQLDTDGRYVNRNETLARYDIGINGTASMIYPLQIAWATTWTTDFTRGLAAKGRTYWPTGVPTSNSLLRVNQDSCQRMARATNQLITDLAAAAGTGAGTALVPAVMSKLREGKSAVITGSRVGDRLDVQRRRAEGLEEQYYTGTGPIG